MKIRAILNCCPSKKLKQSFVYKKKPFQETNFGIKKYYRYYKKCTNCGHHFSYFKFNINKLYEEKYSQSTYGNMNNIRQKFYKITNFSLSKSDNKNRVFRCKKYLNGKRFLDVGAGMGVFPYELRKKVKNLNINLIEKDKNLYNFLKENFNKKKIKSSLNFYLKKKYYHNYFDFISINKVLEHLEDPREIIIKLKKLLNQSGILYLEVPDAKCSIKGKNREEFFIEHLHVFSKKSLVNLMNSVNFKILLIKNIKEKSGKYTLFTFAKKH